MNNSSTGTTPTNTSIPITKMVNDLFLQWLSLPDTRTTLYAALHSVQSNSKMPDPVIYPKVCMFAFVLHFFYKITLTFFHRLQTKSNAHLNNIENVSLVNQRSFIVIFYPYLELYNTWWWFFQNATFRFASCFTCTSHRFKST